MSVFGGIVLGSAGLALMAYEVRQNLKSKRAKSWPKTVGKVLESRLQQVNSGEGITYKAHVLYEYFIDGMLFRSDVWRIGQVGRSSSFTGGSKRVVAKYPSGSSVTVYFNPDNRSDATLEPGRFTWSVFLAGALFLIGGLIALFGPETQS